MSKHLTHPHTLNFNSIKVRLERKNNVLRNHQLLYFNSIKVRLEQCSVATSKSNWEFQFHKGTIRTHCLGIYNILIFNRIRGCKVNKSY